MDQTTREQVRLKAAILLKINPDVIKTIHETRLGYIVGIGKLTVVKGSKRIKEEIVVKTIKREELEAIKPSTQENRWIKKE